jgi:hypothetical protein
MNSNIASLIRTTRRLLWNKNNTSRLYDDNNRSNTRQLKTRRIIAYQYLYTSFVADNTRRDIVATEPAPEVKK